MFPLKKEPNVRRQESKNPSRIYLRQLLKMMGVSDSTLRALSDDELTDLLNGLKVLTRQERTNTASRIDSWQAQIGRDKTSYC
jgi:hypothetical protein